MINKPQEGHILESGSLQLELCQNGSILCREIFCIPVPHYLCPRGLDGTIHVDQWQKPHMSCGDRPVIFQETLKIELYNTYFYKQEAVIKIFFFYFTHHSSDYTKELTIKRKINAIFPLKKNRTPVTRVNNN